MKILSGNFRDKLSILKPYLPYGTFDTWDDLNPQLYHAVHIYWLKFYGLWYYNYKAKDLRFWLHLSYSFVVLWLVCILPGFGEIVYLMRRRDDVGDVAEGLYLFLSEMYTYFKLAVFWLNKEKILNLLKFLHCEEFKPYEEEHRIILKKSIKVARFIMTHYSFICVCAVSVGLVIPLTEGFDILPTNVEYVYFDVYKQPTYGIIYLHHIYYKPATCIIDGAMDTILAAFVVSALGQIEILAFNLRNFKMVAERRRLKDLKGHIQTMKYEIDYVNYILKKCIIHYRAIIRYVSMIEDAFSLASALQFMLSAMVLCLVGVQFLSIENPKSHPMQMAWMAIYLTCMLIEVFILCWFGNELILKSLELQRAAFEGPWRTVDAKTAMYLIIFSERSKIPLKVTAAKIFTLSLDTYTYIINWSYKAFAVIRNVKK